MVSSTTAELTPATSVIQKEIPTDYSALLLLPVAVAAVHQYTKKQMRKAGRKMAWQLVKQKIKAMLSFKKDKGKGTGVKLLLAVLGLGFIAAVGIFLGWSIAIGILVVFGLIALIYSAKD